MPNLSSADEQRQDEEKADAILSIGTAVEKNPDDVYEEKYGYLLEYYEHIYQMNNRLRHRIYHVKKEINHLKQLKRVLCERLLLHRAVIIDSNLEIPDNDSSVSMAAEKMIGESSKIASTSIEQQQLKPADSATASGGRKRKQKKPTAAADGGGDEQRNAKETKETKRKKAKDDGNKQIISIIESIVADTHKAAAASQQEQNNEAKGQQQSLVPGTSEFHQNLANTNSSKNVSNEFHGSNHSHYQSTSAAIGMISPDPEEQTNCKKQQQQCMDLIGKDIGIE